MTMQCEHDSSKGNGEGIQSLCIKTIKDVSGRLAITPRQRTISQQKAREELSSTLTELKEYRARCRKVAMDRVEGRLRQEDEKQREEI